MTNVVEFKKFSLDAQIKAVEREIGMRERVYPRQVKAGKMRQAEADFQIAIMRAVLETLRGVASNGKGVI